MSIESLSSNQPSAAQSDIEAFKQAKIRARQEREAAERAADKEALLESIFADSPAGDTEEDARRFDEGSAYLAHLEKIANRPENFDPLDDEFEREFTAATAENEAFDTYKSEAISQTKEQIASDPKLRRIEMMSDDVVALRARVEALRQKEVTADEADVKNESKLSALLADKEDKLAELLADYDESSSLPEDEKLLLTNYLMDRATIGEAAAPAVSYKDFTNDTPKVSRTAQATSAPSTKAEDVKSAKDGQSLSDTERAALADMEATDASLPTVTTVEATTGSTPEDISVLENMQSADVSLTEVTTVDATTGTSPEDISVLESMEPADVTLTETDNTDADDEPFIDTEELKRLADMEPADVSLETDDQEPFIDVAELQEEANDDDIDHEAVADHHRRNRFNPLYRARLALNNLGRSRRHEANGERRSRASKIALGAAAVGALALGSLVAIKNNPDWAQDLNNFAGDVWKNLGLDGNNPPSADQAPNGNTNDALDPRDGGGSGSGSNTPGEQAPVVPPVSELLNSPAFNTPVGGGGEALMNSLNIDPRTWYSVSADLPDLFPTEFYRQQLPNGLVDIRFSHPGMLSEEAQKVLLNRLGK